MSWIRVLPSLPSQTVDDSAKNRVCRVLALKRAGFRLADVQSDVLLFYLTLARNRFLHSRTASLMTFCDMLAHVLMRRSFKWLVTAACIADR